MKIRINIILKDSVLDPQGEAIASSLKKLGHDYVRSVRQGKIIDIDIDNQEDEDLRSSVKKMCEDLLTNSQVEAYSYEKIES